MTKRPILIDGGFDQSAAALLLALQCPSLALTGVTTSTGCETAAYAAQQLSRLLADMGVHAPVAAGAAQPLMRPLPGDAELRQPCAPKKGEPATGQTALDLQVQILSERKTPVTLLVTGPLTGVALLLLARPDCKEKIDHITITGGALRGGDCTPVAEHNFFLDPEAADIVLKSGVPAVVLGLDVTRSAALTQEELAALRALPSAAAQRTAALLECAASGAVSQGELPLRGMCAVLWEMAPALFETTPSHLEVETASEFCDGALISDLRGLSGLPRAHRVAVGVDRARAAALVLNSFAAGEGSGQ